MEGRRLDSGFCVMLNVVYAAAAKEESTCSTHRASCCLEAVSLQGLHQTTAAKSSRAQRVAAFLAFTRYLYLVTGIAWDRNVSCFV
jgi:hypothetical protein